MIKLENLFSIQRMYFILMLYDVSYEKVSLKIIRIHERLRLPNFLGYMVLYGIVFILGLYAGV